MALSQTMVFTAARGLDGRRVKERVVWEIRLGGDQVRNEVAVRGEITRSGGKISRGCKWEEKERVRTN